MERSGLAVPTYPCENGPHTGTLAVCVLEQPACPRVIYPRLIRAAILQAILLASGTPREAFKFTPRRTTSIESQSLPNHPDA